MSQLRVPPKVPKKEHNMTSGLLPPMLCYHRLQNMRFSAKTALLPKQACALESDCYSFFSPNVSFIEGLVKTSLACVYLHKL